MRFLLVLLVLIAGCTMKGTVDGPSSVQRCTDQRDGETWDYDTSTIRDVRIGLGGAATTMTLTDTSGKVRHASSDQEQFIKCHAL